MTDPGALAAADWLSSDPTPHPRGGGDGRIIGPLLVVCRVAARHVEVTLCGRGIAPCGAPLVRVLDHGAYEGPGADWFAAEAVRRAGADPTAALTAALTQAVIGFGQEFQDFAYLLEDPRIRNARAVLTFGPDDTYCLSLGELLGDLGPVQETIRGAVRTLLEHRPDLLDRPVPSPDLADATVAVDILVHGWLALPWVVAAAHEAVADWLATGLHGDEIPEVRTHVAPRPEGAASRGSETVAASKVVIDDVLGRRVDLHTHQLRGGRLRPATVRVAVTSDGGPGTARTWPVVVQVAGSELDTLAVDVEHRGRRVTGAVHLAEALPPGSYRVGLLAGREPAGSLVFQLVAGGPPRVFPIPLPDPAPRAPDTGTQPRCQPDDRARQDGGR